MLKTLVLMVRLHNVDERKILVARCERLSSCFARACVVNVGQASCFIGVLRHCTGVVTAALGEYKASH